MTYTDTLKFKINNISNYSEMFIIYKIYFYTKTIFTEFSNRNNSENCTEGVLWNRKYAARGQFI